MMRNLAIVAAGIIWLALSLHYAANALISIFGRLVIPIPSGSRAVAELFGMLEKYGPRGDFTFLDLGASNGRVALAVAKRFPKARAVGIEKNPWMYFLGRLRLGVSGLKNARCIYGDILEYDLASLSPDVVYMYLGVNISPKIAEKLSRELPCGTIVISNKFELPGLKLIDEVRFKNVLNGPLRAYRI
jgi:SAM-dependent methyltransferase